MADLLNIGPSALLSLQRALSTTGQNIANVNTAGYSRQRVDFATLPHEATGAGFLGTGVKVDSITRSYDQFLAQDVRSRSSSSAGFSTLSGLTSRIDNLLADPSVGIAPGIEGFFGALQDVANNPGSIPERKVLLGEASELAGRFQALDTQLRSLNSEVSQRITTTVQDINALASNIASLNEQVVRATTATGGQPPNDLLDARDQAINRMVQALEHYRIAGVKTNIRFLHALADAQPFREADLTTGFIEDHRELLFPKSRLDTHKALVLAAGFVLEQRKSREVISTDPWSPFGRQNSWRMNSEYAQPLQLQVGEDIHELKVLERDDRYQVFVGDSVYNLTAKLDDDYLQAVINGHRISVHGNLHNDQLVLFYEGDTFQCILYRETYGFEEMAGEGSLAAPMNGAIVAVQTKVGDTVTAGQSLVIMEAMKMEHAIKAPAELIAIEVTDDEEAG